jgi:hypothetical protein
VATSVTTITTFATAHWRATASALLAVALLIGGKCYGDAQYARGQELARANIADSVGKVYQARFDALRDSVTRQMTAFRASVDSSNARAMVAEAQAAAAQEQARRVLTPQVIAQTPPQVLALVQQQGAVIDTLTHAVADLRVHLDTAVAREARYASALEVAHQALAQQSTTIASLRKLKEPAHGFWHTVGEVAKVGAGVLTGAALVKVF